MANETDIVEHTAVFSDDADGLRRSLISPCFLFLSILRNHAELFLNTSLL